MSAKDEGKKVYRHYIPAVEEKPDAVKSKKTILIEDKEHLYKALRLDKEPHDFISWDTETTGLNPETDCLVGFSFAFDSDTGYYCPIRHAKGNNLDPKEALDLFYKALCRTKKRTFVFNMRFDYRFMEFEGYDMSKVPYYDVSVGIWLADTNIKFPSLKGSARHFLGWTMDTFEQTLGDNVTFQYLTPEESVFYASMDAISTFALVPISVQFWKESGYAGKLDNDFLYPFMKCEEQAIKINVDLLKSMLEIEQQELKKLEMDIYTQTGSIFKINSNKQLGDALQKMGIHTGKYTDKGQMKVDIKTLESYNYHNPHPIIQSLIEYAQKFKLITSYYTTIIEEAERMKGKLRFAYQTNNVPTSRLSSGKETKNDYFASLNIQAQPKPHPKDWYLTDKVRPNDNNNVSLLGYNFTLEEKTDKVIEGFNPMKNIRRAYEVSEDSYWVSVDFSGQELRVIANYSNEPNWVNAFLTGGDLHKNMAIAMWGEENYNKELRKRAKVLNFGMCVTPNSLILTQEGYVRPCDLKMDKHLLINQYHSRNKFKIKENPESTCYKVMYKNGIVEEYKEGHKMYCWTGKGFEWVEIENIPEDYEVVYTVNHSFDFKDKEIIVDGYDMTKGLFPYIIGLYLGDGYIPLNKGKTISNLTIIVEEPNLVEIVKFLNGLGINNSHSRYPKKDYYRLTINSSKVANFINDEFGRTKGKRISDLVYTHFSKESMIELLSGMLDSDGSFSENKLYFKNTSLNLISGFALISHILGVDTVVSSYQSGITVNGKREYKNSKGIPYKECYELRLDSNIFNLRIDRKRGEVHEWVKPLCLDKELADKQYSIEYYPIKNRWDNIRRDRCRLTFGTLMSSNLFLDSPVAIRELKEHYTAGKRFCKIFKIEKTKNISYQIGIVDDKPEYISSSMVSHNCYGMSGMSLAEKFQISREEGEEIIQKFWKAAPKIASFQKACVNYAKKKGTIYNIFNRPRRVKFWLTNSDFRQRAFGERTVNNTVIQSVGADILKRAFINLDKELFRNEKYKDKVRFLTTVHDEINFEVKKDIVEEVLPIILRCMELKLENWRVPIIASVEIGDSWGRTFPFHLDNETGKWVPSYEIVKHEEKKEEKEPKETKKKEEQNNLEFDWL